MAKKEMLLDIFVVAISSGIELGIVLVERGEGGGGAVVISGFGMTIDKVRFPYHVSSITR